MRLLIYISVFVCACVTACGQSGTYEEMLDGMYKNTVPLISSENLSKEAIGEGNLIILDTRELPEYSVSHLDGALHVGFDDFKLNTLKKEVSKKSRIVVYCSVGYRSERIGEKLLKAGYGNVSNLYGGIFAWKNEGHAVVGSNGKVTENVHPYDDNWGKWLKEGKASYE